MNIRIFSIILFIIFVLAFMLNLIYFTPKKVIKKQQKKEEKPLYVPETLEQCRQNYLPKNDRYIECPYFGNCDGMSGSCIWCSEMTPYQWEMCKDEGSLNYIMRMNPEFTKEQAIEIIQKKKEVY